MGRGVVVLYGRMNEAGLAVSAAPPCVTGR
jgi:hypothetical protein